jgi:hypothetical protein
MVIGSTERPRWGLRLAHHLLLTACWLAAGVLDAQEIGDAQHFGLRRLPPVDTAFPQQPIAPAYRESVDWAVYQSYQPPPIGSVLNEQPFEPGRVNALENLPDPYVDVPLDGSVVTPAFVEPLSVDQEVELACSPSDLPYEPFGRPYNYAGSGAPVQNGWVVGSGDRMGIFTLSTNYRDWWCIGRNRIQFNPAVHFVSGPIRTDMPPQLYDLDIGFVRRDTILSPDLAFELALRVGFFSDFEGSAREGLRFPGHAVVFYQVSEARQWVLGVDYLDRDDIPLLPVFGASFRPHPKLWLEAIFPKPRIAVQIGPHRWWYVAAEMGGGQWAIERVSRENDVVAYRDYRILLGVQQDQVEAYLAFLEIGFVFNRQLEYRSGVGDYEPLNTAFLRTVLRY